MIQIEYLINALKIDVVEHPTFDEAQKKELMTLLDTCPSIPISINPFRLAERGKVITAHLNVYESKYLSFGGNQSNLKAIRDEYEKVIIHTLKGYKRGKMT